MAQPNWIASQRFKGVRWYKHDTRKYGVRFDRCFGIRFTHAGKRYESVLGWESEDWTESNAYAKRKEYLVNAKAGAGPRTRKEELEAQLSQELERAAERKLEKARERRLNTTFFDFFTESYAPDARHSKKPETFRKEEEHVRNWIGPVVGELAIKDIALDHIKIIRATLAKTGRSPRTQQYVFRTLTSVWNAARDAGLVDGLCPTKHTSFKLPKFNNERERFLTREEEKKLFAVLRERSEQVHDMALVALYCGLRFSEIARLRWGRVGEDSIRIIEGKHEKARTVPMTTPVMNLFASMERHSDNSLVFPDSMGRVMQQVPSTFKRAVDDVGLNADVESSKQRFSFHGLRHTYGSRLAQAGADLFRIQKLMGHSNPATTQRYAHLQNENLVQATKAMEQFLEDDGPSGKVIPFARNVPEN
ncbi:site-specific integrase [Pseudodesulfovibrio indicus]|uniref:tyrosine-type recombinase/integrase n=1 Tax=Pseudodesulfovibrio indicus TaxID=1716143 RepID=UPI00293142EC|nr:site-specific integrase [Pseudodesulfovibrio indicus]